MRGYVEIERDILLKVAIQCLLAWLIPYKTVIIDNVKITTGKYM